MDYSYDHSRNINCIFMRDTMVARMYTEDMREICELQEIELLIIWIVINGIYFWIMNRKVGKELKVDDK